MKKSAAVCVAILCILCAVFPLTVAAHSGRTDSSGGHKDNKNKSGLGSYHYHCGGHPAHLHDGGCPYSAVWEEPVKEKSIPTVSEVEIQYDTSEMTTGGSMTVGSSVYPTDAEKSAVSWSSSDNAVALVDAKGKITAKRAGSVTITAATDNGTSASFQLTISDIPAESLTLNKENAKIDAGATQELSCRVSPENATDKAVTWASSNESVATVSENGLVTAKGIGKANITATSAGGITASCAVSVTAIPVAEIQMVTAIPQSLTVGQRFTMEYSVFPKNATDPNIEIFSDSPTVLSVSSTNQIEALAKGTATISLQNKDHTSSFQITVLPILVESLSIAPVPPRLEVGKEIALEASVYPTNAEDSTLTWAVEPADFASIVDGKLVALREGAVKISATSANGITEAFEIELYSNTAATIITVSLVILLAGASGLVLTNKLKKRNL